MVFRGNHAAKSLSPGIWSVVSAAIIRHLIFVGLSLILATEVKRDGHDVNSEYWRYLIHHKRLLNNGCTFLHWRMGIPGALLVTKVGSDKYMHKSIVVWDVVANTYKFDMALITCAGWPICVSKTGPVSHFDNIFLITCISKHIAQWPKSGTQYPCYLTCLCVSNLFVLTYT